MRLTRPLFALGLSALVACSESRRSARDLTMLGESAPPGRLRVFYVGSRDEMKTLVGARYSGYADAAALGVVLVAAAGARPAWKLWLAVLLGDRARS